jgi:hypothetical protein
MAELSSGEVTRIKALAILPIRAFGYDQLA